MNLSAISRTPQPPTIDPHNARPKTAEEAAKEFEKVMVDEFVKVMTKDLFKSNLSGEAGPAWMEAQNDTQRSTLNDVLSKHFVEQNIFNFDELVLQDWQNRGLADR